MAGDSPNRYVATMSKRARAGKIFVDYLRNGRGATAVAPYSTRARSGAPVSTPLAWSELSASMRPDHFTVSNLPTRLAHLKSDPWADLPELDQKLPLRKGVLESAVRTVPDGGLDVNPVENGDKAPTDHNRLDPSASEQRCRFGEGRASPARRAGT